MKISQEMPTHTMKQTHPGVDSKQSFGRMVQSHSYQLKQQEIQHFMDEITKQGDKLARFRSFQDLVKFKRLIKGFLEATVNDSLHLQQSHSFSLEGNNRTLTIVKEVDEKLLELTEELMNQEKKTVDLLGMIGEIKGLLINLYT